MSLAEVYGLLFAEKSQQQAKRRHPSAPPSTRHDRQDLDSRMMPPPHSDGLSALHQEITDMHQYHVTPEYYTKQMHRVPAMRVVDRAACILRECRGKRVLHLGCSSGPLHQMIHEVAASLEGWDIEQPAATIGTFQQVDLDHAEAIRDAAHDCQPELIVVAEVLEHLGNPGQLLSLLRAMHCPLLITVPNAFSSAARTQLRDGIENVHKQHVAWYSWRTLLTLVERYGYVLDYGAWYNGKPLIAEGLIFLVR